MAESAQAANYADSTEWRTAMIIRNHYMAQLKSEWIKNGEMLRLTDAGIDVSDYIFCDFML